MVSLPAAAIVRRIGYLRGAALDTYRHTETQVAARAYLALAVCLRGAGLVLCHHHGIWPVGNKNHPQAGF